MKTYKLYYALAKNHSEKYVSMAPGEKPDQAILERKLHTECKELQLYPSALDETVSHALNPSVTRSITGRPILFRLLLIKELATPDATARTSFTKKTGSEQYLLYSVTIDGQTTDFFDNRSSYQGFLSKEVSVKAICDLLHDYCQPTFGWFLSGHWNRHHYAEARQLIRELNEAEGDIQSALDKLVTMRRTLEAKPHINPKGSLLRRLDFAIYSLAQQEAEPELSRDTAKGHDRAETAYSMPDAASMGRAMMHGRGLSAFALRAAMGQ